MKNPDTKNTGYTINITQVRENRRRNQEWTIHTPITLGTQYTEQRLEKIELAIKYGQSRHRQHYVQNTQNKD
jgi:hypothetical protein